MNRLLSAPLALAVLAVLPALAGAEVTARTAAVLASLPDGATGQVVVSWRGREGRRAYHVTRRGARLTLFDRASRRYQTFFIARSGTIVTVRDPAADTRESFVVRAGAAADRTAAGVRSGRGQLVVRTSLGWRGSAAGLRLRQAGAHATERTVPFARALVDLDETLRRAKRSPTLTDAAVVSFVLDP